MTAAANNSNQRWVAFSYEPFIENGEINVNHSIKNVSNILGYFPGISIITGLAKIIFATHLLCNSDDVLLAQGYLIRGVIEVSSAFGIILLITDIYNSFFGPKNEIKTLLPSIDLSIPLQSGQNSGENNMKSENPSIPLQSDQSSVENVLTFDMKSIEAKFPWINQMDFMILGSSPEDYKISFRKERASDGVIFSEASVRAIIDPFSLRLQQGYFSFDLDNEGTKKILGCQGSDENFQLAIDQLLLLESLKCCKQVSDRFEIITNENSKRNEIVFSFNSRQERDTAILRILNEKYISALGWGRCIYSHIDDKIFETESGLLGVYLPEDAALVPSEKFSDEDFNDESEIKVIMAVKKNEPVDWQKNYRKLEERQTKNPTRLILTPLQSARFLGYESQSLSFDVGMGPLEENLEYDRITDLLKNTVIM